MSGTRSVQETCARVAQILRHKRIDGNLSMTQVADASGLSRQGISYIERGERVPTLDTLLRIAGVLNVDLWKVIRDAEAGRVSAEG